jgi:hypothetical protein
MSEFLQFCVSCLLCYHKTHIILIQLDVCRAVCHVISSPVTTSGGFNQPLLLYIINMCITEEV